MGCNPGWGVLKKGARPGRGQSSWLRDDPFCDLLLVEEQLQQGRSSPIAGGWSWRSARGRGTTVCRGQGWGDGRGGHGSWEGVGWRVGSRRPRSLGVDECAAGGASLWSSQRLLCCVPGFAGTQCKFIPFSVGRTAHGCSHSHISPSASPFHVERPLNSIDSWSSYNDRLPFGSWEAQQDPPLGLGGPADLARLPLCRDPALPLTSCPGLSVGVSLCCVFLEGRWHAERET